jgi:hypothetical protein
MAERPRAIKSAKSRKVPSPTKLRKEREKERDHIEETAEISLRKVSSQIAPNKNTSGQLVDFRPVPVGPPDKRRGGCTAASQVAAILSAPTDMVKVVLALSQFEKCQIGM